MLRATVSTWKTNKVFTGIIGSFSTKCHSAHSTERSGLWFNSLTLNVSAGKAFPLISKTIKHTSSSERKCERRGSILPSMKYDIHSLELVVCNVSLKWCREQENTYITYKYTQVKTQWAFSGHYKLLNDLPSFQSSATNLSVDWCNSVATLSFRGSMFFISHSSAL